MHTHTYNPAATKPGTMHLPRPLSTSHVMISTGKTTQHKLRACHGEASVLVGSVLLLSWLNVWLSMTGCACAAARHPPQCHGTKSGDMQCSKSCHSLPGCGVSAAYSSFKGSRSCCNSIPPKVFSPLYVMYKKPSSSLWSS